MPVARQPKSDQGGANAAVWLTPLAQLTARDRANAGGKAASLGELMRAGLPVPGGFCVTTEAFRLWLSGCPAAADLLARLANVAPDRSQGLAEVARTLRQVLAEHPLPRPLAEAIRTAIQTHGPPTAWAVRSSATAEDSPETSFAGQHDSQLNVRGAKAVLAAVRQCWVSIFTERAVAYRTRNRIDPRSAAMAVVVQEMAPAEVSGVMFTADPVTGDASRLVVEGVFGLGEALVSGKVTPDRVVLEKASLTLRERRVGSRAVALAPRGADGVEATPGPAARQAKTCLDDALARRLGELGRAAERHFGRPLDIEWAARDGQVCLLQARPITALPAVGEGGEEAWTNANIMEALPDVVTPLTWSLMQMLLNDFLSQLMRRLGMDIGRRPLIDLIAGRAYLNVQAVAEFIRKVAGPVWTDATALFGGQEGMERMLRSAARRGRESYGFRTVGRWFRLGAWLLPGLFRQPRVLERWGQRVFGELAHASPPDLTDEQLAAHPAALLRLATLGAGNRTWAAAVWMAIWGIGGGAALFRLAQKWLGDSDGSVANRLLAGATGMNSAENGLELLRLAAWARQRPELQHALLEPAAFAGLESRLAGVPGGTEFLGRWRLFMERHGHQARGGMDIYQPRWSEMPDFVLDMLRVYLGFDDATDPLVLQIRRLREREELFRDCRRRLRNPLKRWLFVALVRLSQRGLAQRENVKNEGVRLMAVLRRAVLEAGRRLVNRGVLREIDEVFSLRLEELGPALRGSPTFDVAHTIAARKTEYAHHQTLTPPPFIVGRYDPAVTTPEPVAAESRTLHGVAVSPGVVTGRARVIRQADASERLQPGEILVAPYTDPGWTPYFLAAAGLVVEVGGLLSHGSVVAREYGLPAVVNVDHATRLIQTGRIIRVDGSRGVVTLLD